MSYTDLKITTLTEDGKSKHRNFGDGDVHYPITAEQAKKNLAEATGFLKSPSVRGLSKGKNAIFVVGTTTHDNGTTETHDLTKDEPLSLDHNGLALFEFMVYHEVLNNGKLEHAARAAKA